MVRRRPRHRSATWTSIAFGHSYCSGGTGTITSSNRITKRFSDWVGCTDTNYGVGASVLYCQNSSGGPSNASGGWVTMFQNYSPSSATFERAYDSVVILAGCNDMALMTSDAQADTVWKPTLRACIDRARCGKVYENTDASVSFGGSWSTNTGIITNSGANCRYATSDGKTVTIQVPSTFPGGTVIVGGIDVPANTGAMDFTVDGAAAGSLSQTGEGNRNRPITKRLTGLAPGAHTIIGTTSAISASNFFFDWWGVEAPFPPAVLVFGTPRLLAYTGYTTEGWPQTPTDTSMDTQTTATRAVADEYDNRVVFVPMDQVMNGNSSLYDDSVHPAPTGCSLIAAEMYGKLNHTRRIG